MNRFAAAVHDRWNRWRSESVGAAAAEFALVLSLLVIPFLNAVDLGIYVYQVMELKSATQIGAQQAWSLTDPTVSGSCSLPLTQGSCQSTWLTTVQSAVKTSSPLSVSASNISGTEGYYCINSSGSLVEVGLVTQTEPTNCAATSQITGSPIGGSANDLPGDYLIVTASYTYVPVFSGVSILDLLCPGGACSVSSTSWSRLQ